MYKISELAKISGVTTRTLRYYDRIGLLKPEKMQDNGYRMYSGGQVDDLQQILFYRELGIPLDKIKKVLTASGFDRTLALEHHLSALQNKKEQIDLLIKNVQKTIRSAKEGTVMSDKEKFEGFKSDLIKKNEANYGKEIRKEYGEETVDATNKKFIGMSQEKYEESEELRVSINEYLGEAFKIGDPACDAAQKACDLHRKWLCMFWKDGMYSKEAHAALADGYVSDARFTAYYDKIAPGCTVFFRDAIKIYCGV